MKYGLTESDLEYIISSIKNFNEIEKAAIFGSRAKGNHNPESDVDIAIFGEQVSFDIVSRLHSMLEDKGPLPYCFDIVDYTHLNHIKLKEHIDRVGRIIFERVSK